MIAMKLKCEKHWGKESQGNGGLRKQSQLQWKVAGTDIQHRGGGKVLALEVTFLLNTLITNVLS